MAAPPVPYDPVLIAPPTPVRRGGPLGWLVGGVAAVAAVAVAVLFAAALAVVALLALVLALLAYAAWRVRGARGPAPVIAARWTGYRWDAGAG